MKKYKVGIIRVLTTVDESILLSHQEILSDFFKDFDLETQCIPDQYEGIHDDKTLNEAVPKIIKMAKDWEDRLDGLIISCAGDPAVKELKNILKIPVVGAGHSVATISRNYGEKVGIIGIEKEAPPTYIDILKDNFLGYEKPNKVENTNDLQTDEGKKAIVESAKKLKKEGADVLAFACTGLSTAKAYKLLRSIDIPIIDGVIAEGTIMLNKLIENEMRSE
ncbi:MAG: aspartate/glutamate racemase family protein [Bacillota bacterium]|nr:aspartate/glutamate racemase family protein [Bacillota bacterium]